MLLRRCRRRLGIRHRTARSEAEASSGRERVVAHPDQILPVCGGLHVGDRRRVVRPRRRDARGAGGGSAVCTPEHGSIRRLAGVQGACIVRSSSTAPSSSEAARRLLIVSFVLHLRPSIVNLVLHPIGKNIQRIIMYTRRRARDTSQRYSNSSTGTIPAC